jgi:methylmalonyl-CoA mutase cobalamin-binding subunit
VALVLAGTSFKGLTTTAHVLGTTQSSQADARYNEIVATASQKPADVIVVSSKNSTSALAWV